MALVCYYSFLQQQLLLAQQELTMNNQQPTPENLKETLAKLKTKQKKKKEDMFPSEFVGEDAVRYMTKIAINSKEADKKQEETTTTLAVQPSPSLSREQLHKATSSRLSVKETPPSNEPTYKMEYMAKENDREEELRKKWPENLPWPSLGDCKKKPPAQYMVFTSTWLSVTAKKIKYDHHILMIDTILDDTTCIVVYL